MEERALRDDAYVNMGMPEERSHVSDSEESFKKQDIALHQMRTIIPLTDFFLSFTLVPPFILAPVSDIVDA